MDYKYYMEKVIDIAKMGQERGESPFAALLVSEDKIIEVSTNKSGSSKSPLMHAELSLLLQVSKLSLKYENLILFSTCEPCIMCFWAAYLLGVKEIVFGATIEDAISFGSGDIPVKIKNLNEKYSLNIKIVEEICRESCRKLFVEQIRKYGKL